MLALFLKSAVVVTSTAHRLEVLGHQPYRLFAQWHEQRHVAQVVGQRVE